MSWVIMEMGNKWATWADEASGHSLTLRLMYNKCHMIKHEEQLRTYFVENWATTDFQNISSTKIPFGMRLLINVLILQLLGYSGPYQSSVDYCTGAVSCIYGVASSRPEVTPLKRSALPKAPPPNSNTCTVRGWNNSILGAGGSLRLNLYHKTWSQLKHEVRNTNVDGFKR